MTYHNSSTIKKAKSAMFPSHLSISPHFTEKTTHKEIRGHFYIRSQKVTGKPYAYSVHGLDGNGDGKIPILLTRFPRLAFQNSGI